MQRLEMFAVACGNLAWEVRLVFVVPWQVTVEVGLRLSHVLLVLVLARDRGCQTSDKTFSYFPVRKIVIYPDFVT